MGFHVINSESENATPVLLATLVLATVNVNRLATYMPYLKAGNHNFQISYSSLLIRFSDANSLDEITEPASPTPEECSSISDVSVTLSLFDSQSIKFHTKLEAVRGRLFLNATSWTHIYFNKETNVGERYFYKLFYSDTEHASAAPLLRGYAKVEPLTIAELNEFGDKNEEELRKLQCTVSAFTCFHCNNTNAVGVLRYGVEMVIADDTVVEEATEMKLKIHFGGSMKKDGEGYVYVGETGTKNVEWKIDEITWERFSLFCKEDSLIRAPIGLLWFKFEKEEMKDLRYAYDYLDEEMRILRSAGKLGVDVVEVFVEHIPNTKQDERSCSDEDEDVDRPKEDDEPEESKDENPTIQDIPAEIMTGNEAATGENQNENDDVGDELVVDAADGGSDSRFKSIFDEDPVKYTSEYYYTHKMKKTYNENIKPVNGENLWKRLGKPSIGIPELRKSRGRPRTRERGEKSHLKTLKTLENRQDTDVCPNVAVAFRWVTLKVVAKMNKWFMRVQRTNVDDLGPPKPPSTRRKRTSSSQPVQAAESSSQIPTHSTAPQPSVSSSDPKPHAKKAPRGPPLKVRKTTNIPHGVGTLWSPFTNRPFEVLGDRVYDRSDLNPQPPPQE
ncbi:hypothetical protein YC2023_020387 [Brassica napus]